MTVGELLIVILLFTAQITMYAGIFLYFRFRIRDPQKPPSLTINIPEITVKQQPQEQQRPAPDFTETKKFEEWLKQKEEELKRIPPEDRVYEDVNEAVNVIVEDFLGEGGNISE